MNVIATILCCAWLLVGCVAKTIKTKDPHVENASELQSGLQSLITAKHYNLSGKEISTNGKVVTELEVSIINGSNVPSETLGIADLSRKIANTVMHSLKDSTEFDNYNVLFVKEVESQGVTKRDWVGHSFKLRKLR